MLALSAVSVYAASIFGDIMPQTNNLYSFGNTTHKWKNAYINNMTSLNVTATNITALGYFIGNGSLLTNLMGISGNTSAQIITAINNSGTFDITSWKTWYVDNATERELFTNTYNASYLTNSYNASYDAQLGHNTTAEVRAAIYSTTMNISNITSPTDCPNAQYVYGKSTYLWNCRADLFNTTAEIQAAVNSTTYYPTANLTFYGTDSGGNNIGNLSYYDNQFFNITEASGGNALLFYVNFTGVADFNTLLIRERYDGGSGHQIAVEIYDYVLGAWEGYFTLTDQATMGVSNLPVFDPADHLSGNVVMVRFRHVQNGVAWHLLSIDYIQLVDGFSSATTIEHDALSGRSDKANHPWAFPIDASRVITGNVNITGWLNATTQLTTTNAFIYGWANSTNTNATQMCLGNNCITSWIVNTTTQVQAAQTINTSAEVNAALNSTFTGQLGKNTTAEIRAAQTVNTSAEVNAALNSTFTGQLGKNTSVEINAALNSSFYTLNRPWIGSLYAGNVSGITTYNSSYDAQMGKNTSAEINAALNSTFTGQLGHNTTTEINAALNSTFTGQLGKNTTAEIRTAIYSTTMNLSNITDPTDCPSAQFVYGKSGSLWACRADLFNTTAEIQAAQKTTGNTTNEIFKAVDNNTFHRYNDTMTATNITASITSAQLAQAFSILWGNVTGRSLDIVWAGGLDAANITTGTLRDSLLNGAVYQINGTTRLTQGNLSSTFSILNANVSVTTDFDMNSKNMTNVLNTTYGASAQAQIYWNGTHLRIRG